MFKALRERRMKKRYFKIKVQKTLMQIWDLEFRRDHLRGIREAVRQQRDRVKETSEVAKRRQEEEAAKGEASDKKVIESLENLIKKCEPDLEQMAKQLSDLENETEGTNVDGEVVNAQAVTQLINGNRQLLEMLSGYRRKL